MNRDLDIISLNKKAWNRVAKKYETDYLPKVSSLFDFFCSQLPTGSFILDLGSGTGLPYAKKFIKKGFKVLGIDISSQMIKIAQRNVPDAEFIEKSMTELDYENKFNGVFSSYTMLLLDPPLFKDVSKRVVQSLKKEGLFYLSLNEPWEENIDVDGEVIIEIMGEKMYSRAYTEEEILDTFSPLGLKCLKIYRKKLSSEEFGIEHMMALVFEKIV